ncbi:MAG: hypothetical protein ACT4PX_11835 [Actinomycetota bacterium]
MDAAQLRPLAVGEILDLAIKIYRERFAHLVKAVGVVVAPVSVLGALIQLSLPDSESTFDGEVDELGRPVIESGDVWGLAAGLIALGLVSYVASQLAAAASFKLVSGAYLDEEPDWRRSLSFATGRLGSLVWLTIVFAVLLLLAVLACFLPGVYFYVAWTVAVPVLLLEDVRGRKALKRSRALVKGRWWPTAGVLLVAFILSGMVQFVFSGLLLAVASAGSNDLVDATAQAVANTAASVLTTPFTAAVIMVVYFDLRVRKEGFDLELLAQRVGVEPGPGAWSAPAGGAGWPPAPGPPGPEAGQPPDRPPFWPPPPGWRPGPPAGSADPLGTEAPPLPPPPAWHSGPPAESSDPPGTEEPPPPPPPPAWGPGG